MTPENVASAPPWPIKAAPWPKLGSPATAGLESIWAVGTVDGPVLHFGSAADPRSQWGRLQRANAAPLVVHDLRWAQGRKGRALGRALHRVVGGPIAVAEYLLLVAVEAARLGITLAGHVDTVAAVQADRQADLDAFMAQCQADDDRYALQCNPALSLAETKGSYEEDLAFVRDVEIEERYASWESKYRRSNPTPLKKLFQRNRNIVLAYKSGLTLAKIGAQYGLSFGRVRQILDSQGVDRRPKGGYLARQSNAA